MRISDWSSDVCSSDLRDQQTRHLPGRAGNGRHPLSSHQRRVAQPPPDPRGLDGFGDVVDAQELDAGVHALHRQRERTPEAGRSEEHTSELQSLMRISYAVFCLKKKKTKNQKKKKTQYDRSNNTKT